jgi:Zn-dependent protease with chaperone function
MSWHARKAELAADRYALALGAHPTALASGLVTLFEEGPIMIDCPVPLRWTQSHPDLSTRFRAAGLSVA